MISVTLLRSGVSPFWNLLSLLARPENNTREMFAPTAEELETKKKEKERRERRAARREAWLQEQAAKQAGTESADVPDAETSRAARRRKRDERRAQAAKSSSSSSSSSEEEGPNENMDAEDIIGNDSCIFAATTAGENAPDVNTDVAGSSDAESETNPGPFICLFCGEDFPSEAAEDYHVMRECSNK